MAKQTINTGSLPNDKTGDPLRTAFQKINDNFAELYGDDSSADTFTSPQITTPTITGTATIDNLIFNDSQISTSSNANLELNPGGTGTVELQANTNVTGALDVTGAATLDTSLTLATGATITEFATSTSLGTSDTKVPTQNAVKAYVDAQNVAQAITFVGDDSTGTAVNSGEIFKIAGGTGLTSAVVGDALTLDIDATVATLTGGQTLTNKTLTTPTISSPNITGHATIEGVTPTGATGTGNLVFSASPTVTGTLTAATISASGTLAAGNTTISGSLSSQDLTVTGNQTVTGNITAQGTVFSDKIKSPASNANLSLSAQGTGIVDVQSPMTTVAQTISGNVTVPDNFITQLGNIQIYSNTLTSTTNGDINIVTNAGGRIILNSPRASTNHLLADEVTISGNLNSNNIRSNTSNADITIQPQGIGRVKIVGLGLDTDSIRSTTSNADLVIGTQGTGNIDVSGVKITNLGTPSASADAATKNYVDGLAGYLVIRAQRTAGGSSDSYGYWSFTTTSGSGSAVFNVVSTQAYFDFTLTGFSAPSSQIFSLDITTGSLTDVTLSGTYQSRTSPNILTTFTPATHIFRYNKSSTSVEDLYFYFKR